MNAKDLARAKIGSQLKKELTTKPVGAIGRLVVIGGVIFMAYAIIGHNGDFREAIKALGGIHG